MSQRMTFADWLIRRAARGAPPALCDRLQEEWRADLLTRTSALSRLRFSLGCCWATVWIAREYALSTAPAAASAHANVAILREEPGLLAGRSTSFLLVVLLHAVVFYALFVSLGPTLIRSIVPPALVPSFDPPHPADPIKVSTPETAITVTRSVNLTIPEITLPPVADGLDRVVGRVPEGEPSTGTVIASDAPPEHMISRTQGGPGAGFPNADDFYPQNARRLEEQGNVIVQVCVDPKGRLTSDPIAMQSSGNSKLDAGALILAKAGSGHYRPTTEDGRAISSCYPFKVVFRIKR
jgi:TonB family protein